MPKFRKLSQDQDEDERERRCLGTPPASSADWGWVQPADYNLSPSLFVDVNDRERADAELARILAALGLEGGRP